MSATLTTKRQAKLIKVSASKNSKTGKTNNNNKFYNMTELGDGTFKAEFGRVEGGKAQVKIYPMSKWDATLKKKLKGRNGEPPYKDISHLVLEEVVADTSDDNITDVEDRAVAKIITDLQSYATGFVQKTYSVSSSSVTQAMIDEAQGILDWLVNNTEVGARKSRLNDKLQELFMVIPRKMKKVEDHLFPTLNQANIRKCLEMLSDEQDTLDTMAGQVSLNSSKKTSKDTAKQSTMLDLLGLELEQADQSDFDTIYNMMDDACQYRGNPAHTLKKVFRVVNKNTQVNYDKNLKTAKNKTTRLFFHGSRNQNWLNILKTGLMIRPAGAIHNGSMWDDGLYFAEKASKSLNYTSLQRAVWNSESSNKGYMALFEVHLGKQLDKYKHDSSCYNISKEMKTKGYDSVFAHAGASIMNSEIIVYQAQQCTIKYLIELES